MEWTYDEFVPVGSAAEHDGGDNAAEDPKDDGSFHRGGVVERRLAERRRDEAPYGWGISKPHFRCACMAQSKSRPLDHSITINDASRLFKRLVRSQACFSFTHSSISPIIDRVTRLVFVVVSICTPKGRILSSIDQALWRGWVHHHSGYASN